MLQASVAGFICWRTEMLIELIRAVLPLFFLEFPRYWSKNSQMALKIPN